MLLFLLCCGTGPSPHLPEQMRMGLLAVECAFCTQVLSPATLTRCLWTVFVNRMSSAKPSASATRSVALLAPVALSRYCLITSVQGRTSYS